MTIFSASATITRQQLALITLGAYNQAESDVDLTTLAEMDYKTACEKLKKARDKVYADHAERHLTGLLTKAGGGPFAALFRCNLGGPWPPNPCLPQVRTVTLFRH